MKLIKINPDKYIKMPWKNGGGISYEIFKFPDNASNWEFRLSLAKVDVSGPFSTFPGCLRTLILLSGKGMILNSPTSTTLIDDPFRPHHFSGDEHIQASLIDGGNLDFNFIWAKDKFEIETTYYDHPVQLKSLKDWLIVFNISSQATTILSGESEKNFETKFPSIVITVGKKTSP